jgi:hypothetical protein
MATPLHVSKKQQIEYSPHGWMALMTKRLHTRKMHFNDFVDEGSGVKSSFVKE